MTAEVEIADPGTPVREVARKMRDLNVGFMPVCAADGSLIGILTDRDIAVRVVAEDRSPRTPVEDVMTTEIVSCRPSDDIRHAEELMRVNQKSRIPCVDENGIVVGVISLTDIAQYEAPRRTGELLSDISDREVGGGR
jgi:CBS domain-containing protein